MKIVDILVVAYIPTMLLSGVITSLISRYRLVRQRKVSLDVVLVAPICSSLIYTVVSGLISDGWQFFTPDYWEDSKGGYFVLVLGFILLFIVSIFPAVIVVRAYQKRVQNEKRAA